MKDELRPYAEYKDTGLEWLGAIPSHWSCLPHRAIFEEIKDQGYEREELLSVTIARGVMRQEDLLANSSKKDSSNLDKSRYKLVQPGDIAYNKMRAWQGAVGASNYRGIVSPAYIVQRPRGDDHPKYFHYLFRTPAFASEAERWSYGITSDQWSLRPQHFKLIYSCIPFRDEQYAIVRYLESEDRCIRRFIRNRRQLIKVLNEQKQAIIQRTVTRGLDLNVRLKSSSIDWLGEIPEHWEVLRLGRRVKRIEQGWSPQAAEGNIGKDQWAVLTLSSVRRGVFNASALKPIERSAQVPVGLELSDGDCLITRSNTRDRVGDACVVSDVRPKTIFSDLIYRLKIFEDALKPQFLVFQLLAPLGRGQIERDARGSSGTMPKIAHKHIKSWLILSPPIEEQQKIIKRIQEAMTPIDQEIVKTQQEIRLIREYRTRLISDVVTGKVDVRHLVLSPESEDQKEPLEELDQLEGDAAEINETEFGEEINYADD